MSSTANQEQNNSNSSIKSVEILCRLKSKKNSTHDSIADTEIQNATLWKTKKIGRVIEIFLWVISVGIFFILEKIWPNLKICLALEPAYINDADYIKIVTKFGNTILIELESTLKEQKKEESSMIEMEEKTSDKNDDDTYNSIKNDDNDTQIINDIHNEDDKSSNMESNEDFINSSIRTKNKTVYNKNYTFKNKLNGINSLTSKERKINSFKESNSKRDIQRSNIKPSNTIIYKSLYEYRKRPNIPTFEERAIKTKKSKVERKSPIKYKKSFKFLSNKYDYDENEGLFVPVTFYINRYLKKELHQMKQGIPDKFTYGKIRKNYSNNKIEIKNQGLIEIILKEIFCIQTLYIFFCVFIWIREDYDKYAIIISCVLVFLIFSISWRKMENLYSLKGVDESLVCVIRAGKEIYIKPENIVPGDSIILKKNNLVQIKKEQEEENKKNQSSEKAKNELKNYNIQTNKKKQYKIKNIRGITDFDENENEDKEKEKENTVKKINKVPCKKESEKTNKIIVPCDGIILEGYCTVNESDLTGENTLVLKKEITYDDSKDEYFDYSKDKHAFLFQGTQIHLLYNSKAKSESLLMLATDTGYNSYRGNMIKSWENQHYSKSRGRLDVLFVGFIMVFIFVIDVFIIFLVYTYRILYEEDDYEEFSYIMGLIYFGIFKIDDISHKTFKDKIDDILDKLTVIIPPSLLLNIMFSRFYFNTKIKEKRINCVDEKRIDNAGRLDVVVLDKTGTLTESRLDIYCYKANIPDENGNLYLGDEEFNTRILNKIYIEFWEHTYKRMINCKKEGKRMDYNYQNSYLYNIIFFTECLAVCHNVFKINNQIFGNSVDQKLYEEMKWDISQNEENIQNNIIIQPHKAYKITESTFFGGATILKKFNKKKKIIEEDIDDKSQILNDMYDNKSKFNNNETNKSNDDDFVYKYVELDIENNFYLKYLKRFDFHSKFQSMSVIVQNSVDNSIRIFTKGAPEKIRKNCNFASIPLDLDQKLRQYTGDGYRVLAAASRKLDYFDPDDCEQENLEKDMTFLGLIIFQNHIKKDTAMNIKELIRSKSKLVIATGDNVFTTVSVAQQCGILDMDDDLYRLEYYEEDNCLLISHNKYTSKTDLIEDNFSDTNDLKNKPNDKNTQLKKSIDSDLTTEEDEQINYQESQNIFDFEKLIKDIIKKDKLVLCCSGPALMNIIERIRLIEQKKSPGDYYYNEDYVTILSLLLRTKGKIFYRMLPDYKSNLVALFQSDRVSFVAMCGDGANDCNAFMQSDVGFAINQTSGNNLISHFYTRESSIGSLVYLIKCGRACYECRMLCVKWTILNAIIEIATGLLLYFEYQEINDYQYLLYDCFIILIPNLLMSRTRENYRLSKVKPPKNMINKNFIFSTLGLFTIEFLGLIGFVLFIKDYSLYWEFDILQKKTLNVLQTYVSQFHCIQFTFLLMIINIKCSHRRKFYTNKLYMLYWAGLLLFLIAMTTLRNPKMFGIPFYAFEPDEEGFNYNTEFNKFISIIWNIIVQGLALGFDTLINHYFDDSAEGYNFFVKRYVEKKNKFIRD